MRPPFFGGLAHYPDTINPSQYQKEASNTPRFIAVVGCQYYFGYMIFKPGQRVKLIKDPENVHDSDAVTVDLDPGGKVSCVANSVYTVPRGCRKPISRVSVRN